MSNKDIIIYQKLIYGFKNTFVKYKRFYDKYVLNELLIEEYPSFMYAIRQLVSQYYKYLKYYYRCLGIEIRSPRKIIERASKEGLINDGECWLKLMDYYNLYYINNPDGNQELLVKIIDNFYDKPFLMLEYMHSDDKIAFLKEFEPIIQEYYKKEIKLDNSTPMYKAEDLDISERSYKIILDYFKSTRDIKNVWLHGSRLLGTNKFGADLDIIIDCLIEKYDSIVKAISELPIPYYIDCKCLNADYSQNPIKLIMNMNPKKIYCAKDFEYYW